MTENVRMVITAALTISAHVALLLTSSIVKGWVKIARLVLTLMRESDGLGESSMTVYWPSSSEDMAGDRNISIGMQMELERNRPRKRSHDAVCKTISGSSYCSNAYNAACFKRSSSSDRKCASWTLVILRNGGSPCFHVREICDFMERQPVSQYQAYSNHSPHRSLRRSAAS